jgi:selenide,water dikinase
VISTALKKGIARDEHVQESVNQMLTLNKGVCESLLALDVQACTDVTGFGLLGHAREMALASDVTLEISASAVRFLPGAIEYSAMGAHSGGLNNNRDFVESCVKMAEDIPAEIKALLYDPQTSGGLLASMGDEHARMLLQQHPEAYVIGKVKDRSSKPIEVTN